MCLTHVHKVSCTSHTYVLGNVQTPNTTETLDSNRAECTAGNITLVHHFC